MTYEPKMSSRGEDGKFQSRVRLGQTIFLPETIFDLMHEGNAPMSQDQEGPTGDQPATIYEPSGPVLEEMSLKQIKSTLSEVRELQTELRVMQVALQGVERKLEDPTGVRPPENNWEKMFGVQAANLGKEDDA